MTCPNGHPTVVDTDRFCPVCGEPVLRPPTAVESSPVAPVAPVATPTPLGSAARPRRRLGALLTGAIVAFVLVAIVATVTVVVLSGGSGAPTRYLIGTGAVTSSPGLDLYLVDEGQEPVPAERIGTSAVLDDIVPIDGPYEMGIEGPIAPGPRVQRIGNRTAISWWRAASDVHTSEIVFVADDGTVTPVMKEQSPPAQGGPISSWYSKDIDALLVTVSGTPTRCYRVGADAVPVLLVSASNCVFRPGGLVWSVDAAKSNSYDAPAGNQFVVALHDLDGALLSTTTITGVSGVEPNGTGERTYASTSTERRIYETRTGGLIAQASGARGVRSTGRSRNSNVSGYVVDNDNEQLAAVIVRGDGSKIELGNFERVAVTLSADGTTAFVSSSSKPPSTASSGTTVTVKVERVDVESGRRETLATGTDLRTQLLGWDEEIAVIWSPEGDRLWRGPVRGELVPVDVPVTKKSGVTLVVQSGEIVVIAGGKDSVRADIITANGSLVPVTTGWGTLSVVSATLKGRTLLLQGSRGDRSTLMSWTERSGIVELDSGAGYFVEAVSGNSVVYQVNTGSTNAPVYDVKKVALGGGEPTILWTNSRLLSSPHMGYTVDRGDELLLGSSFLTPYVDDVAARCRSRGEPVIRRGGSAVGTIGSTDVCIIVTELSATVHLAVTSSSDTTMTVTNSSGSQVAYDDDSGYSTNPEILKTLIKGTYIVSVDAYGSSSRNGGTFSLRYD